jgi:hypothetical protein
MIAKHNIIPSLSKQRNFGSFISILASCFHARIVFGEESLRGRSHIDILGGRLTGVDANYSHTSFNRAQASIIDPV